MAPIIALKNVVKHYRQGKQRVEVLHGLDLDCEAGEFLALMGLPARARRPCSI
jgi:ABC-type lipoprotein export system ATPase subunit